MLERQLSQQCLVSLLVVTQIVSTHFTIPRWDMNLWKIYLLCKCIIFPYNSGTYGRYGAFALYMVKVLLDMSSNDFVKGVRF